MKLSSFKEVLRREGYTPKQIIKLNAFGYRSALDAHAGLKDSVTDFGVFCAQIGRDFVIENLDDLVIDDDGNVTWAD